MSEGDHEPAQKSVAEGRHERLARRLVMSFYKTSTITDKTLEQKFKGQTSFVVDAVIPRMVEAGAIRPEQWSGGSATSAVWTVRRSPDDLLRAREGNGDADLVEMWAWYREAG